MFPKIVDGRLKPSATFFIHGLKPVLQLRFDFKGDTSFDIFCGKLITMNTVVEKFVFLNQIGLLERVIVLGLFLIVIFFAIRYTRRLRSLKRKIILISLRSLSFLLIVFILLNPAI